MTTLDKWQREDGWPSDDYFTAIEVALADVGVAVHDSWRNEDWDATLELDRKAYMDGPLGWAKHGVFIGWRADEECDPLTDEEFRSSPAWRWVPYSKPQAALGDFVKDLEHPEFPGSPIDPLEEPEVVAAAVLKLVRGGDGGE